MYNSYYGFTEKPFSLTPDPHFLYLSSVHKRALAYLTYGLEDKKGFITITGEIGAGKTTLIRALMKQLDTKTTVSRIINPKVSSLQLLKMILRDFSLDVSSESKDDLLDRLNTFLLSEYSRGHSCVIVVDEAQNLEPVALEEIRLLSNLETDKDKLLQIILVGQPELREILSLPELKQLRQRVTVSYHISPLTMDEVNEYIRHRLLVAGIKDRELFSQGAMRQIALASKGIPRLINIICDAALVTGYVEGAKVLNEKLMEEVLAELDLEQMLQQSSIPVTQQNTVPQKSESGHAGSDLKLQNLEIQGLIGMVSELRSKLAEKGDWEKKLKQKEDELDAKETELCGKLKQVLQLEQKLLAREEQIRQKEQRFGVRDK